MHAKHALNSNFSLNWQAAPTHPQTAIIKTGFTASFKNATIRALQGMGHVECYFAYEQ
jgi:hypothetical protein